jgi:hypothetical protein
VGTCDTVAAVLGTSYHQLRLLNHRLPYLLFVPGWVCLAISLYKGNDVSGRYLSTKMVSSDAVRAIASDINNLYDAQRTLLLWALVFLTLRLAIYLYLWILLAERRTVTR